MSRLAVALFTSLAFSSCKPSTAGGPGSHMDATAVTPKKIDLVKVSLRNLVDECVRLDIGSARTERNVTLAAGQIRVASGIGKCGCKSAVLSYRTVRRVASRDMEVARGQINTLKLGQGTIDIYLVVATDHIPATAELTTIVGCENPE